MFTAVISKALRLQRTIPLMQCGYNSTATESFEKVGHELSDPDVQQRKRYRSGINRVELLGGVGNRPNERVSRNGQPYCAFSLYTNTEVVKNNGEVVSQTEMHSVMAFGNLARYVQSNIDKGSRVFIQGRLHYTGGVLMGDGNRSPRVANITADYILPVQPAKFRLNDNDE